MGNDVLCMDHDHHKIALLRAGKIPFYEPGLAELVQKNSAEGRLRFTTNLREAVQFAKIIFLCVGTPPGSNGEADLSAVEHVTHAIAKSLTAYRLIVEKSTVPVETGALLHDMIAKKSRRSVPFDVASNPEFLREGTALQDFFNPDRIVLGVENNRAKKLLLELYKTFKVPVVVTDIRSAEIIKHASNSFLASKISLINLVSQVCAKVGADVNKVAEGIGADRRIGKAFLNAGIGFGGSCFPKDLMAFIHIAERLNVPSNLLREVVEINEIQKVNFINLVREVLKNVDGKTLGILGLAFKPDTDDMRSAPSVDILKQLKAEGAKVVAYDPRAVSEAKKVLKGIRFAKNAYEACRNVDAVLIMTEWREFRELDLKRLRKLLKRPVVIDGRNIYDPATMKRNGFQYHSVGR